jgi:Ca2+-binding EF-hand superfamily protein
LVKELFSTWDLDGDGIIQEAELLIPLVSLGLAPDHKVAKKICKVLDPLNGERKAGEEISLRLEDFMRIFEIDRS